MFELLLYGTGLVGIFYLMAILSDEFFVPSLDAIAKRLNLPSDVAGATLMAVGSSAPELFTSFFAVFRADDLANVGAGTIVGSAIFNILVIIGASAMFRGARLTWQPIVRDALFYSASILLLLFVFWDGRVGINEAWMFVALYVVYIFAVVFWKKILPYDDVDIVDVEEQGDTHGAFKKLIITIIGFVVPRPRPFGNRYILTFLMSLVGIAALSHGLVESAVHMAAILQINPTIVALTILAAGTSIPDLLSSVIVARQGRGDMAVSNAIGSNIFDILFGLGFPWMLWLGIHGGYVSVATENLISSIILLFATVISILFVLIVRNWWLGRRAGIVLIGAYFTYLAYIIYPLL